MSSSPLAVEVASRAFSLFDARAPVVPCLPVAHKAFAMSDSYDHKATIARFVDGEDGCRYTRNSLVGGGGGGMMMRID